MEWGIYLKTMKVLATLSAQKVMAIVFWNRHLVFCQCTFWMMAMPINLEAYHETSYKTSYKKHQNKLSSMLSYSVVLLHNNTYHHFAIYIADLLQHLNQKVSDQPDVQPGTDSKQLLCIHAAGKMVYEELQNNVEV